MSLFWERGMVLFQDGKKPTNIPQHSFCGSLKSKEIKHESSGDKSIVFADFFFLLMLFFQISFVKVKPTSYLNDLY